MYRFSGKDPKALMQTAIVYIGAWKLTNFSHDPLTVLSCLGLGGTAGAVPHTPTSSPNVAESSHVITPYQNNLEVTE